METTREIKSTWRGRKGVMSEILLNADPFGKRVVILRFIDNNETTIRGMDGVGYGEHTIYYDETIPSATPDQINAAIDRAYKATKEGTDEQ